MARPRKSSRELLLSGAPANKIAARIAEETANPSVPDTSAKQKWLPKFLASVKKEQATFIQRIVAGETVCLELGGVAFNWREVHPLTMAKMYADQTLAIPVTKAELPILRTECLEFLEDLKSGHERGLHMDPVAADSLELMFDAFDRRGWICSGLALFDFVQFVGSKKPDGTRRYSAEDWLHYKHRNVLAEALRFADEV